MYIAAFIYTPGQQDAEFTRLSALIDAIANDLPGFAGAESWRSADGQKINASYYWHDKESLHAFAMHPTHLDAKRQYRKWYDGFQVIISKVERSYGDGGIKLLVEDERHRTQP